MARHQCIQIASIYFLLHAQFSNSFVTKTSAPYQKIRRNSARIIPLTQHYLVSVSEKPTKSGEDQNELTNLRSDNRWSDENLSACVALWELNKKDEENMCLLKENLSDIKHWINDPFEVVRYLVEYEGDVDTAEEKFRDMVEWRIKNNVDSILNEYEPPPFFNYFPLGVLEDVDRDGDPIHVERTGASDMVGLLEKFGKDEMIKHAIWTREQDSHGAWQKIYEQKQGRRFKQFTIIVDLQNLSMKHLSPKLTPIGKEVTRFVQDNYPGQTKRIIVIRSPGIFRMAWSMFKPFIDQSMKEKIVFSGSNYEDTLKEYVDLKILPSVICSQGQGEAAEGFQPIWEGGKLPKVANVPPKKKSELDQHDADMKNIPMGLLMPT